MLVRLEVVLPVRAGTLTPMSSRSCGVAGESRRRPATRDHGASPSKAHNLDPLKWVWFAGNGWTFHDWDDLDDITTWDVESIAHADQASSEAIIERHMGAVREWLRHPPVRFGIRVSPATVRATFAQYGRRSPTVLSAYAAGATTRFVHVFLTATPGGNPEHAWVCGRAAGLDEPAACGWAATAWMFTRISRSPNYPGTPSDVKDVADRLTAWTRRLGPTAYLWVLAGFTLDEALALYDGPATVTDEQLRVMTALNGVSLPAGV